MFFIILLLILVIGTFITNNIQDRGEDAARVFRFMKRKDLASDVLPCIVTEFDAAPHDNDVVCMTKLNISSDSYSSAPFVVLPFENLVSLNWDSLSSAPLHSINDDTRKNFLKTADTIAQAPFRLTAGASYLRRLISESPTLLPDIDWVRTGTRECFISLASAIPEGVVEDLGGVRPVQQVRVAPRVRGRGRGRGRDGRGRGSRGRGASSSDGGGVSAEISPVPLEAVVPHGELVRLQPGQRLTPASPKAGPEAGPEAGPPAAPEAGPPAAPKAGPVLRRPAAAAAAARGKRPRHPHANLPALLEEHGVTLGCTKCRRIKLGCSECRKETGFVWDVDSEAWEYSPPTPSEE